MLLNSAPITGHSKPDVLPSAFFSTHDLLLEKISTSSAATCFSTYSPFLLVTANSFSFPTE